MVPCKDTPNFIANRIGSFFGATVHKLTVGRRLHHRRGGRAHRLADRPAQERELPPDGHRRPGRVGARDCAICTTLVPDDPWRDRFLRARSSCKRMIERGWLGDKSGQGFYKRVGKAEEI